MTNNNPSPVMGGEQKEIDAVLQPLVEKFVKENPNAGKSFAFCQGWLLGRQLSPTPVQEPSPQAIPNREHVKISERGMEILKDESRTRELVNQIQGKEDGGAEASNSDKADVATLCSSAPTQIEQFRTWLADELKAVSGYHTTTAGGAQLALLMVLQKFDKVFPTTPTTNK